VRLGAGRARRLQRHALGRRVLAQSHVLHRALGERAALQQLVVGRVEVLVLVRGVERLDFLVVEHARQELLDLDRGAGAVHRGREVGAHHREEREHGEDDEDRPLALEEDAQQVAQVERLLEAVAAREIVREVGKGGTLQRERGVSLGRSVRRVHGRAAFNAGPAARTG